MACEPVQQFNDFVGDGSTVDFTFTFPYIKKEDVDVRMGVYPDYTYPAKTEYSISDSNPTVLTFNVAPSGPFRIFRCTTNDSLIATFQAGSAIRAADLNDNFEQLIYVVQDANVRSDDAQESADEAYRRANIAIEKADQAIETADEAKQIAEDAEAKADAALDLVKDSVAGEVVATVADLPGSPEEGAIFTVLDSTGVENLTPLTALPDGFVGDPGLAVKLQWNGVTYVFLEAYAVNPDARYVLDNGPADTYLVRYNKTWVDSNSIYYTKTETDNRYYTKAETDAKYVCKDFTVYPELP